MEYVIKRDGTEVPFDKSKIVNAVEKAMTCKAFTPLVPS